MFCLKCLEQEMEKMEVGKAFNHEKLEQSSSRKVLKSNPERLLKEISGGIIKDSNEPHNEAKHSENHIPKYSGNKGIIGRISGFNQIKSFVTVSWRIPPRGKHEDDHQPGFDMDYSPPKTHPPSHN